LSNAADAREVAPCSDHARKRTRHLVKETPVDFPMKERVTHVGYPPAGGKRDEKESGSCAPERASLRKIWSRDSFPKSGLKL